MPGNDHAPSTLVIVARFGDTVPGAVRLTLPACTMPCTASVWGATPIGVAVSACFSTRDVGRSVTATPAAAAPATVPLSRTFFAVPEADPPAPPPDAPPPPAPPPPPPPPAPPAAPVAGAVSVVFGPPP